MHDYHTHSNYSDGDLLFLMLSTAEEIGLDGIGVADHCNVSEAESFQQFKREFGFNLDLTHQRRREALDGIAGRYDLRIYDAVEMDYRPAEEDAIESFLSDADFDYAVGSVHTVEERNLHDVGYFAGKSRANKQSIVDTYVDRLVAMIDSELFAIAGHLDLPERNEALRGLFTEDHYHRVAAALSDSRTVPELNAGRVDDTYGHFHPGPTFREVLAEYDVRYAIGSDAHDPGALEANVAALSEFVDRWDIDPVVLDV